MATDTNKIEKSEEELEAYRQKRIKDFVLIMKNLEDVNKAIPSNMTRILKRKLDKELRRFLRERE